jgi:hypothetical protein
LWLIGLPKNQIHLLQAAIPFYCGFIVQHRHFVAQYTALSRPEVMQQHSMYMSASAHPISCSRLNVQCHAQRDVAVVDLSWRVFNAVCENLALLARVAVAALPDGPRWFDAMLNAYAALTVRA